MNRKRNIVALGGACLALLAGCSSEVGPRACTLIGCNRIAAVDDLATLTGSETRSLDLRLCHNDVCSTGRPTALPDTVGIGLGCGLSGDARVTCTVRKEADDRYRVSVAFLERDDARDGDRYTIRAVHTPSGTVVAEASQAVTYTTSRPNGADCPPVCHQATIDVTRRSIPPTVDAGTPDAGAPDASPPDAEGNRDSPGRCFEIFPTVEPPSASTETVIAHSNPMEFHITAAVGSSAVVGVRYYNFCADPEPRLLAVTSTSLDGSPLDPSLTVVPTLALLQVLPMSLTPTLNVTFRPRVAGVVTARVRLTFSHGYYDTVVTATGTP